MRIVLVSTQSPYPPRSGGPIRLAALANGLAALGTLRVVSLCKPQAGHPPAGIEEVCLYADRGQNIWAGSTFSPLAPRLNTGTIAALLQAVGAAQPDIIIVSQPQLYPHIAALRRLAPHVVLDLHNIEADLVAQRLARLPWRYWPGNMWRRGLRRIRARAQEGAAVKAARALWLCSENDKARAQALWGRAGVVVANAVPNAALFEAPITPERYQTGGLIFVGLANYRPNTEAMDALCTQIMPHLPAPFTLQILGRNPHGRYQPANPPANVSLHWDCEDLAPRLAQAGFAPMPIHSGGGTRIKALEAMAAGAVLVASAKAVEGLGLVPDVHFAPAETAEACVATLQRLQANPEAAAAMAERARSFAQTHRGAATINRQIHTAIAALSP